MSKEKHPVKRKLPKKSKRPKRRYLLFQLKPYSCKTAKQAFDLVIGCFSPEERKVVGVWFIEFSPETGKGIVRCRAGNQERVKSALMGIPEEFEPKTLLASGTLRKLRAK